MAASLSSNSVAVHFRLIRWIGKMEVPAFKFKFVSGSIIVLVCYALVFLPTILQAIIDPGNNLISEIKFTAQKDSASDVKLCSTATSSLVFTNVRSKIECSLMCQKNASCTSVNFKDPRTCEMFLFNPGTFASESGCVYFSRGENFFLDMLIHSHQYTCDKQKQVLACLYIVKDNQWFWEPTTRQLLRRDQCQQYWKLAAFEGLA